MKIWLIDATTYRVSLSQRLIECKRVFFRLKTIAKDLHLGEHRRPGEFCYSSGLLHLATILTRSGHDVEYLTLEDAQELIEASPFPFSGGDVVGFGAVTPTVPACARLANVIKSHDASIRVVLGGAHVRIAPELTRSRYPVFDQIIPEDGRTAAALMLGTNIKRLAKPDIPFDYSILPRPLSHYCLNIATMYGCPWRCEYCHDRFVDWKEGPLDGDLLNLLDHVPNNSPVHVMDSSLGGTPTRALAVCQEIAKIDHKLLLSCDLRAEAVSSALLRSLEEAGFSEVRIGLESLGDHLQTKLNRGIDTDAIMRAIERIRTESDLYISVYVVTGLPGSTCTSEDATRIVVTDLLRSGRINEIKHHLYVPYPTDDPGLMPSPILIEQDDWSQYDRQSFPVYSLPSLSASEIWEHFLRTHEAINDAWSAGLAIDLDNKLPQEEYPEYNLDRYLRRYEPDPPKTEANRSSVPRQFEK